MLIKCARRRHAKKDCCNYSARPDKKCSLIVIELGRTRTVEEWNAHCAALWDCKAVFKEVLDKTR